MSLYGSFNQMGSLEATEGESKNSFNSVYNGHAVVEAASKPRPSGTKLVFENVYVDIDNCQILKNVSGTASSGEILAILGPSGAGKSTLLNALTGRRKIASGRIRLDDYEVDRNLRRRISYVLQNDVFYPRLTLKETLTFTAKLKLPESTTAEQREKRIQAVVDLLELNKCINTKMGGIFETGLSGGERKRASIACELIHNPNILVLDEPTSGLDSAIASSLMRTLTDYAEKSYKTVITTIHQPSSQIFRMFNNVMFLTEGQVAYYGASDNVIEYFSRLNFRCDPLYNPADFVLELTKSDTKTVQRIIEYAETQRIEAYRKAGNMRHDFSKPNFLDKRVKHASEVNEGRNGWFDSNLPSQDAEKVLLLTGDVESRHVYEPKWATSFSSQYATLIQRSFVLSRSRFLSVATLWQILIVSLFVGFEWFQIPRTEEAARDKLGLIFVILTQQCHYFMQTSLPLIYDEHGVFIKERAAATYRLPALILASMTAEVPVTIVIATVCLTIPYWIVGLMPTAFNYFAYLGVHLLNVFLAQSVGYFVGSLVRDRTMAATFGLTVLVVSFLSGGYYNTHINEWFTWIRYISFTTYIFSLHCDVEFIYAAPLRCNHPSKTSFPEYCINGTLIPGEAFVRKLNIDVCPSYVSIIVVISVIISLRLLTYIILRYFRRSVF